MHTILMSFFYSQCNLCSLKCNQTSIVLFWLQLAAAKIGCMADFLHWISIFPVILYVSDTPISLLFLLCEVNYEE